MNEKDSGNYLKPRSTLAIIGLLLLSGCDRKSDGEGICNVTRLSNHPKPEFSDCLPAKFPVGSDANSLEKFLDETGFLAWKLAVRPGGDRAIQYIMIQDYEKGTRRKSVIFAYDENKRITEICAHEWSNLNVPNSCTRN